MLDKLQNELLKRVHNYIKDPDELKLIEDALKYGLDEGMDVKHYDGSIYIHHVLRTTLILTELHSDATALATSLVWWIPAYAKEGALLEIEEKFGSDIARIADSLMKISKLKLKGNDEYNVIYLRKILVGLSTDYRVIIIKLANRLDNLKYVYTVHDERQTSKCIETEKVLIPIAHRLGINYIKSELEDICLKYMEPEAYHDIEEKLDASYEELNGYIESMKESLSALMESANIKFRIKGRVKSIHSLYGKLQKGKSWNQIYDILALRIIVERESECYLAIGLIHSKYRPIPKRFKDYIAQPKENMYQSIHTGVIGPKGKIYEIQIRTEEMDELAENGIASHWSYKENGTKAIQNLMEQKLEVFRDAMEMSQGDEEAVEEFEKVFVNKMIYVLTPKGDVIELPEGSTPIDFAYKIHSHIGDTIVGAIVNSSIVPLDYKLQNDDIIKINTNESSTPKKEWMKIVVTSQARSRIKAYFSKKDREEYILKGSDMLARELKRRKISANDILTEENIKKILKALKVGDFDEVKFSIGSQRYTAKYVLDLIDEKHDSGVDALIDKLTSRESNKEDNYKNDIIVEGCDNVLINIASCCRPVYGDDIIGYITKGNGITVHKASCINLENMEARFIDVSWNKNHTKDYVSKLIIRTDNKDNHVLDIVTKTVKRNLYMDSINAIDTGEAIDYELYVRVPDAEVLRLFILDLESLSYTISVERENK